MLTSAPYTFLSASLSSCLAVITNESAESGRLVNRSDADGKKRWSSFQLTKKIMDRLSQLLLKIVHSDKPLHGSSIVGDSLNFDEQIVTMLSCCCQRYLMKLCGDGRMTVDNLDVVILFCHN